MCDRGREPGEKASPDGVHVKLLGYKWDSKQDILYPGFAELNLSKKIRGAKKSNILPVITLEDAGRLLSSVTLTRGLWFQLSLNCMIPVDSGNPGNCN